MKQNRRPIDDLTDREIIMSLYVSQLFIFVLAVILSFFVFKEFSDMITYFMFDWMDVLIYGVGFAFIVVMIDIFIYRYVPKHLVDDGGINERVFRNLTIPHMLLACFVIAVAEEFLFRLVLQTAIGLIPASILFAIVHVRYIKRPLLFGFVLLISFSLGVLFEYTGSIIVTIIAHFLIDFIFGYYLRRKFKNEERCSL